MTEQQVKTILNAIGVSSGIILIVLIFSAVFLMYKNYLETKKLKLQIQIFEGVLNGNIKV